MTDLQKELDWIKAMKQRKDEYRRREEAFSQNTVSLRQTYLNSLVAIDKGLLEISQQIKDINEELRGLHNDAIKSEDELLRSNVAITNQLELQNERIERILEQTRQFEVTVNDGVKRITSSILYAAAAIVAVIVVF